MGRVVLIGGGARSGKSAMAERLALELPGPRAFLATGQALDEEMAARIARHRADRGDDFQTVEEPLDVPGAILACEADVLVIDCLTLWISNLLMAEQDDDAIEAEIARLVLALDRPRTLTVLVSNEVGLGIVPMNALARRFRDLVGRAHQRVAARADEVWFGAMGILLRLKPAPGEAPAAVGAR